MWTPMPEDPKPVRISREGYDLRTMYKEDAIMELEISASPLCCIAMPAATYYRLFTA